jgi:hypothetical protein
MTKIRLAATVALVLGAGFTGAAAGLPIAPLSTIPHLVAAPPAGPLGPEGVPVPKGSVLADPQVVKLNQTIDGITCQASEKVVYHIHAHLTIFVRGKAQVIPYGIGIGPPIKGVNTQAGPFVTVGSCFMWLHTHALDGILHIESPAQRIYTLGQFFAVWGQPLTRTRVGPARGKVTAFYNGKVWTGNPSSIPLMSAGQIQLDGGTPIVAPQHIAFPQGLAIAMKKSG